MSDNMQNTNNDLLYGIKSPSVGNTSGDTSGNTSGNTNSSASTDSTDPANLQQVSETTEVASSVISPENVVIKKDAPVTGDITDAEDDEKSSNELDTSTTKIEDREEDSESYMDDTVDY